MLWEIVFSIVAELALFQLIMICDEHVYVEAECIYCSRTPAHSDRGSYQEVSSYVFVIELSSVNPTMVARIV